MSLSADVPKNGFEANRMAEQEDLSLGERAKDALNTAAEKTKDFVQSMKEKIIGNEQPEQTERSELDIQGIAEQKRQLDRHLMEQQATASATHDATKCHGAPCL